MANWNLVWLQQTYGSPAPPRPQVKLDFYANRGRDQSAQLGLIPVQPASSKEPSFLRETTCSLTKREDPELKKLHMPKCLDMGRASWKNMRYFKECHSCMWNDNGSVKTGTKL